MNKISKKMKLSIIILLLSTMNLLTAQDYFAIVTQDNDTHYHYPPTVTMTLIDQDGKERIIENNQAVDVSGDYTLNIDVPWSKDPEIIKSKGGRLEIFRLPTDIRKQKEYNAIEIKEYKTESIDSSIPQLQRKELFESLQNEGEFNLLLVFNNGLVFRWFDGLARAWQDGEEIDVTNRYLVQTNNGLLKVSFDASDGETWWIWDM